MHKLAIATAPQRAHRTGRPHLSLTHVVRPATVGDVADIHDLVTLNAERGLVLPRTSGDIASAIHSYITVADGHGRVMACAALQEYSPSLAEVGSVAVVDEARGQGLGSMAVLGVEAVARRRGVGELFALSLADHFFESLGYRRAALDRYPEKLARYDMLARQGVEIVPKSCFRKLTDWR